MQIVVLDFETFFSDDFTLSKMTTESYIRDPRFEAHGAAVKWAANIPARWYAERELRYVLKEHDWSDTLLVNHHSNFDGFILSHHHNIVPKLYACTLNMARLLLGNHIGVSLDSVRQQFGIPLKKTPYNLFKGKHWHELDTATQELVGDGACDEVESVWRVFSEMAKVFPPTQFEVVDALVRMFVNPVLQGDRGFFAKVWEAEAAKKQTLLEELGITEAELQSADRFADLLREQGVEPEYKDGKNKPIPCFAKTDQFMKDLLEGDDEVLAALAQARLGVKSTIQQTRAATLGWAASRGALPVYIRAYGAKTTRPSGGDGSNWLNMKKADPDMPPDDTNTNLKGGICAPPGYLLAPIDASQIECIAEDELVLTEYGPKAIQDVKLWERVWDGQEFVDHGGVVDKGIQEVISYAGLTATPTHVVYPAGDRFPQGIEMRAASALGVDIQAPYRTIAVRETPLRSSDVRGLQDVWCAWNTIQFSERQSFCFVGAGESSASHIRWFGDRSKRQRRALRAWEPTTFDASEERQQPTYDFLGPAAQWLATGYARFQARVSAMHVRSRSNSGSRTEGPYGGGYRSALRGREVADDLAQTSSQKKRVYDIVNAGPRHRFMVSGVIVSNCRILNEVAGQRDVVEKFRNGDDVYSTVASAFYGYPVNKKDHPTERQVGKVVELQAGYGSGGAKILATLCNKAKIILPPERGNDLRDAYRNTHPAVVDLWKQGGRMLSRLAGGPPCRWGPVEIRDHRMWLPNGCPLIYDTIEYHQDEDDNDDYWRVKTRRGWEKLYGAKLVENLIQALAWNLVSDAMVRIARMGYRTLNCPYDELLILIPHDGQEQQHLQKCKAEMTRTPPWLPNLPLDCEGELQTRYGK